MNAISTPICKLCTTMIDTSSRKGKKVQYDHWSENISWKKGDPNFARYDHIGRICLPYVDHPDCR